MTYSLPTTGESNWGIPLNNYIIDVVLAQANLAESTILAHQVAVDPHEDRAYALGLVEPITSHVNQPNGYVVLNQYGVLSIDLLPSAGGFTHVYDVGSAVFGGNGVLGVDNTNAIQNALLACSTNGGGEVWIPNGLWIISSTLLIGNDTWLNVSPGATIIRGVNPTTGLKPPVMLSNFTPSTVLSSITGNIRVTGGVWDATNKHTQSDPCTVMAFANVPGLIIEDVSIEVYPGNPCIRHYGCSQITHTNPIFITQTPFGIPTYPSCVLHCASSVELPFALHPSMYTNNVCSFVTMDKGNCPVPSGGYYINSGHSYCGFTGIIGSLFAPPGGAFHNNISVSNCAVNGCSIGVIHNASGALWDTVTLGLNQAIHGFIDAVGHQPTTNVSNFYAAGNSFEIDVNQWTNINVFGTHWGPSGSGVNGIFCRLTPDNRNIEIRFDLQWSGTASGNQLGFTLPSQFCPSTNIRDTCGGINRSNYATVWNTNGQVQFSMFANQADYLFGTQLLPLDEL
jgi:hypothetical protein